MQKVYLLLRNNRQSGPYTIDELWQQQLRPSGMIWVEGKSTAWAYLSELELLPSPAATDPLAAHTGGEIERKAEELRKKALSLPPYQIHRQISEEFNWDSAWEQKEKEEEPIDFIDHRKEKNHVLNELLMTGLIIALFVGGLYGGRNFFIEKKSAISPINRIESHDRHEAVRIIRTATPTTEQSAAKDSSQKDSASLLALEKPKPALNKKLQKETTFVKHDSLPESLNSTSQSDETTQPLVQVPLESSGNSDAVRPEKKDSAAAAQPEKKKTFGQALRGLFHKRKRDEDKTVDTTRVTEGNQ